MNNNKKLLTGTYIGISLGCIVFALFLIAVDGDMTIAAIVALIPAFLSPLFIATNQSSKSSCVSQSADSSD